MNEITIALACIEDAKQLLEIYSYYVDHTAITFEYEVPSLVEFQERIRNTLTKFPYLVAKKGDKILGYAYASAFHERKAYQWCVETSIYINKDIRQQGIGKKLYLVLEEILKAQNFTNLNACIAVTDQESLYLDDQSQKFHEHMGYHFVGRFHQCGYKFNCWFDMIWMEKAIHDHTSKQKDILSFDCVKTQFFNECNILKNDKRG